MDKDYPVYTILVNSSDGFEDCWSPFFKLFTMQWPQCKNPVLLNTEFKNFDYPGLNLKSSKSNAVSPERRLTWSECLINALRQVDTLLVLYLQEDYFFEKKVNEEKINEFASMMIANKAIKYIGLTHTGNSGPFIGYENNPDLCIVERTASYRISTQAGLWQKETLLSYLRPEENGWMFEIFGTQRAKKRQELFLTANREKYNPANGSIIEYIHTGIIKGRWHPAIPALFTKHGIEIDFSKRGFYKAKPYLLRKIETARKLLKNPIQFLRGMWG